MNHEKATEITDTKALAKALECLCEENQKHKGPLTLFADQTIPEISLTDYIQRIATYWINPEESKNKIGADIRVIFISAIIYLDRLKEIVDSSNETPIHPRSIHRVFLTAVLIATKFHSDFYYWNNYYAKVGGVKLTELNKLEAEMLFQIQFNLFVKPEIYETYNSSLAFYRQALEKSHKRKKLTQRKRKKSNDSDSEVHPPSCRPRQ